MKESGRSGEFLVNKRPNLAIIIILFTVTVALYSRAAYFPFSVLDDRDYITENVHVTSGFSISSIKWAFTTFHASNWHPVTWLSLLMDSQLFGMNPVGYHLVNVLLHALNASLLFLLFNAMTGAIWRSAFVAALFALHPLHVESVAWITERKDVLSTLFWMLTLLFYSAYVKKSKHGMYYLSLVAFALGLMAKPMLVTIPVVLLLLDFWPFERLKIRLSATAGQQDENKSRCRLTYLLLEKIPYLALAAASSALTVYAQSRGGSVSTLTDLSLLMRVNNALWSVVAYMRKTILPFDLAIFYPLIPVPIWKAVCALILICLILYMSVRYLRRYPWLATGWLWYLITLTPVIGLVQVGSQSMADRYTYIPLIGLFTMASWGGGELYAQLPKLRTAIGLATGGVLLLCSITTWFQLGYWQNDVTLLNHALSITHDRVTSHFTHYCLGVVYEKQGKKDLALAEYREALRDDPLDPRNHATFGSLLIDQGNSEEGIDHLEEAIRLDPRLAQAHYNMGVAMARVGRIDEAIREYNETLKIEPNNTMCHNNLGALLANQGMLDEAAQHFSKAVQLDPNDEKARANLQMALKLKSQMPVK
jgi:tetratricopeptide (TPR) repeat protein